MGDISFIDDSTESQDFPQDATDNRPDSIWPDADEKNADAILEHGEVEHLTKDCSNTITVLSKPMNRNTRLYRLGKTSMMVLAPAVMALYLELVGPTLPDLMHQTQSDYEEISRVLVARSAGILLGSLLGGILTDKLPNFPELFMCSAFILGGLGTALIPFSPWLELLAVMFHIQGLAFGFMDVCNNHLCIKMWQQKASSPIHALHFGYGMGALMAPQLARQFVSSGHYLELGSSLNNTLQNTTNTTVLGVMGARHGEIITNALNLSNSADLNSSIEIPYLISASISILFSVVFCLFHVFEKCIDKKKKWSLLSTTSSSEQTRSEKKKERRLSTILNPGTCTGGDTMFGAQFFVAAFFLFFNAVGGEHGYTKFVYTFAKDGPLNFSSSTAATVNTLFWICFMGGRGSAILLSRWLHPRTMLLTQLIFVVISGIALSIWGSTVPLVLWIFTGIFATFLGPVLPAGISWCNRYVQMKGTAVAMVFLATGTGSIFYQWLTGYLFQYEGAHTMMYVVLGFSLFISSVFLLLLIIVRHRSERFIHNAIVIEVTEGEHVKLNDKSPSEKCDQ